MKMFVLVAAMLMVAGSASAEDTISILGDPSGNAGVPNRDICWSAPPDWTLSGVSSEIIPSSGLETEVGSLFFLEAEATIWLARWGGTYYNYSDNMPDAAWFNLFWYDDPNQLCAPQDLLCMYVTADNCNEMLAPDGNQLDDFVYETEFAIECCFAPATFYWFVVQCGDHRDLPGAGQWGRQGTPYDGICESVLRSEYFGFPDWTPMSLLGISPQGASSEFDCRDCGPVPTSESSWGEIKSLYR